MKDPSLFTHELGHNILGSLDENNRGKDDIIHGKYEEYAMWPGPNPNATYHPNVWEEIDRDGPLGLSYVSNWEISYQ